jgi:hypothetical protein
LIVSTPAVLVARPVLRGQRLLGEIGFFITMALACGTTLAVLYGPVLYMAHIGSLSHFREWMAHSASDVSGKTQTALRMVTGIVRGLYNLGQDSVWFKWYLFHDSYARVSLGELFRASLLRIVIFYAGLACMFLLLWPTRFGKRMLLLLLILGAPHIGLALQYESASPERYLAPLGLVAVALGYVAGSAQASRFRRGLAQVLLCAPLLFNAAEAGVGSTNAAVQPDVDRITPLLHIPAESRVIVLNSRDGLFNLRYAVPFHPIQREHLPRIDPIQPFNRAVPWRVQFACTAVSAWAAGGEVWITKRLLKNEPIRPWLWIDAEDEPMRWAVLNPFFTNLDRGEERGGEDGFFKLAITDHNRILLTGEENSTSGCDAPAGAALPNKRGEF